MLKKKKHLNRLPQLFFQTKHISPLHILREHKKNFNHKQMSTLSLHWWCAILYQCDPQQPIFHHLKVKSVSKEDGCLAMLNIPVSICAQTDTSTRNSGAVAWYVSVGHPSSSQVLQLTPRRDPKVRPLARRFCRKLLWMKRLNIFTRGQPTSPELHVGVSVWTQMAKKMFNMA